jgi:hypothetical protein
MPHNTRRNPIGPLLSPERLAEVEKAKRGAPAEKRWKTVVRDMGPITGPRFREQYAYYKHLGDRNAQKAEKAYLDRLFANQGVRGGRTRRARMSRRR